MASWGKWVGASLAAVVALGSVWFLTSTYHRTLLPSGTGIVAKQICSMTFISGLEPDRAQDLYLSYLLEGYEPFVRVKVDDSAGEVTASLLGLYRQRAEFREGLGCTLTHGKELTGPSSMPQREAFQPLPIDVTHRAERFDEAALDTALGTAFSEPQGSGRNTLAVVVLHDGKLVAERYAEGVSAETPLLGWSMTKSVTALLAGVAEETLGFDVSASPAAPLEETHPDVSVDHLLRMTAGLEIFELNDGTDPNSNMLFTEGNMASFASSREAYAEPGESWSYMSGQTVLAMAALQDAIPGDFQQDVTFLRERLFHPLGIHTAIIEPDQSGTMVGSSYMFAAAQDWARVGQLVLDEGLAPDGRRILPAGWTDYIAEPTTSSYGSGFWLMNDQDDIPTGTLRMDGFQGQAGYIVPTHDLVIVRLGATNFQSVGDRQLVRDVIASLRPQPTP